MAAKAGIAAVVVALMAGRAFHVVISVQDEILIMIEGCRYPFLLGVAPTAITRDLLVERIFGRLVAGLAFPAGIRLEQGMVEAALDAEALYSSMIAMTGEAILLQELLMEWRARQWLQNRLPERRQFANLFRFVAGRAAFGCGTRKRCVTGKAVRFEFAVTGNQLTGANHQVRIHKGQDGQNDEIDR